MRNSCLPHFYLVVLDLDATWYPLSGIPPRSTLRSRIVGRAPDGRVGGLQLIVRFTDGHSRERKECRSSESMILSDTGKCQLGLSYQPEGVHSGLHMQVCLWEREHRPPTVQRVLNEAPIFKYGFERERDLILSSAFSTFWRIRIKSMMPSLGR